MSIYNYVTTAASNTTVGGAGAAGSNKLQNADDSFRGLAAELAKFLKDLAGNNTVGGTADAITITTASGSTTALDENLIIGARIASSNTDTTVTLNVDGLGAEPVKVTDDGAESDPAVGQLVAGEFGFFIWRADFDSSNGAWEYRPFGGSGLGDSFTLAQLNTAVSDDTVLADSDLGLITILVPASAMLPAITSGPSPAQLEGGVDSVNLQVLDFDASADETAHFQYLFPKAWDAGTISFKYVWTTSATDTDGVAFALKGESKSDGEAWDDNDGTAVVVTDDNAAASANLYNISDWSSAVTITGAATDEPVNFAFYRDVSDANDDMAEDARLVAVLIRFTVNTLKDD